MILTLISLKLMTQGGAQEIKDPHEKLEEKIHVSIPQSLDQ